MLGRGRPEAQNLRVKKASSYRDSDDSRGRGDGVRARVDGVRRDQGISSSSYMKLENHSLALTMDCDSVHCTYISIYIFLNHSLFPPYMREFEDGYITGISNFP